MNASSPSPSPKRRWFLKTALAVAAVGGAIGGGVWWRRGLDGTRLTDSGKEVFRAVARGILGPLLPAGRADREAALDQYLINLENLINTMPSAKRDQISLLAGALANAPTRYMITGMWSSWAKASDEQIRQALDHLSTSESMLQNTTFVAARALTCMAFFTIPDQWSRVGYPGPFPL